MDSHAEPPFSAGFRKRSDGVAKRGDNSFSVGASWVAMSNGYCSVNTTCASADIETTFQDGRCSHGSPPDAACPVLGAPHIGMMLPVVDLLKFSWETDPFLNQIFNPEKVSV